MVPDHATKSGGGNVGLGWYTGRSVMLTGGSGFIGGHLIALLTAAGARLTNLDTKPPLAAVQRSAWREGSLLDPRAVASTISETQPDVVFNLAAETDLRNQAATYGVNTEGLRVLISACRSGRPSAELVHFSTQLVVRAGYEAIDDADLAPYTSYGDSKAEAERILRGEGEGLRWTIVRPTVVWGPNHPTMATATLKYLQKRWYFIPADAAIRSYGYVENVVEQVARIPTVDPSKVDSRVFYLGEPPMRSEQWLDAFSIALTGRRARRMPNGLLWLLACLGEFSGRLGGPRPFDLGRLHRITQDHTVPVDRTIDLLGSGNVSFRDGVAKTVAWFRQVRR
jgi:nucleoside-diphosphate-sugar epimerase